MNGRLRIVGMMIASAACAGPLTSPVGSAGAAANAVCAPRGVPLWTASTGPISRTAELSVVRDVSGDGVSDLLVAEHGLRGPIDVALVDGGSGGQVWRRRFEDAPSAPAVWLDLARGPSVLVACDDTISLIDGRAGVIVREIGLRAPIGELAAARLDADGVPDLVYTAGVERDELLVALSGRDFSELWMLRADADDSRFGSGFTRLAVVGAGRDGADDVIVCENMRSVLAVSGEGAVVWEAELAKRTTYVPAGAVSGPAVLGDFLGGGLQELAIGLWAGTLVVVDPADGEVLARRLFGVDAEEHRRLRRNRRLPRFLKAILAEAGEPINELLAVELDGVSGSEIVFGCSDGFVYAYAPRADQVLWSHDCLGQVYRRPAAVDANGDGVPDVLAWDERGVYLIDGRDGSELEGFPPGGTLSNATVADLDGDGAVELIELRRDGSLRAFATGLTCAQASGAAGCGR